MSSVTSRSAGKLDLILVIALVGIAVGLRAWHLSWGLPDFTEEAIPLHLSFAMRNVATGAIDPNPHAFSYPTLGVYLHLLVQQASLLAGRLRGAWDSAADYQLAFYVDPAPMVLASRWLGVACDALAVVGAWRIGRSDSRTAGILAGLLIALSATFVATARSIYVDSIMACLAVWALERMLAWHRSGGFARFAMAALLVGLAAGAKYPAAVLVVPLAALAVAREGRRGVPLAALGAGIAALAFVVVMPWVFLDPAAVLRDFRFEGAHAVEGHFGSVAHRSFGFHLRHLIGNLGWPAFVALVCSPVVLGRRGSERPAVLALWLALLAFLLPISLARIDAERYLLPVVATAAILAALSAAALLRALRAAPMAAAAAGVVVLVAMPLAAGVRVARTGAGDTQVEARRWCESHVGPRDLLVTEGYGPRLVDAQRIASLHDDPAFRHAGRAWRERIERVPSQHVVAIPLAPSGRLLTERRTSGGTADTVTVAAHASAIAGAYYEPALYADADWFVTTGAVRGRYEADPGRFPTECHFYERLDRTAKLAAAFRPGPTTSGPEIRIYRLGVEGRGRAFSGIGALDPLWWTSSLPAEYVRRAEHRGEPAVGSVGVSAQRGAPLAASQELSGEPATWVADLLPLYLRHLATFVSTLAQAQLEVGHFGAAAATAMANHRMMPQDVPSAVQTAVALQRLERWSGARAVLERTRAALGGSFRDPSLELLYARSLLRTGERSQAISAYRDLVANLPERHPAVPVARRELTRALVGADPAGPR